MLVCVCCGLKITGKYHEIERGKVCDRCWNDPNLFFPEKLKNSDKWEAVSTILNTNNDLAESLNLSVIKLRQKELTLYTGKMKVKDLLRIYGVFSFEEETLEGYQRELYENKVNDLYRYLIDCPVAVMPGLFISIREGVKYVPRFKIDSNEKDDDIGTLNVPIKKGAIWIIDGQHRMGGFEKVLSNVAQFQGKNRFDQDSFQTLMNYELPVTFIDSKQAIDGLNHSQGSNLTPIDIERLAFFIFNKTQHRLNPSLKDTLQYCITTSGMSGIPIIERETWRVDATSIAIDFNSLDDSPFHNLINISGQRGLNRPIQLNSFVSSLKPLFRNVEFSILNNNEKKEFLLGYWKVIKRINESAFSEKKRRNYLILKVIGIYTLNYLCLEYIRTHTEQGRDFRDDSNISRFINRIKGFDWSKSTSPVAHFGGLGGVKEALSILTSYMFENTIQDD